MEYIETKPAPRLPLKVNIGFRRSYARQQDVGILTNISLTGAFLKTKDTSILPTDKIVFDFVVSGRKRQVQAKVVWKNQNGCGVQFKPFNNRDVQIVDDFMYFVESKRSTRKNVLEDIFRKVG